VQWIAREPGSETAATLLAGQQPLIGPDILLVEVANALWKKTRHGDLQETDVTAALTALLASDLVLAPTVPLLSRAVRLAVQTGHPVSDCVYLALAQQRGAAVATADTRLARTAGRCGIPLWKPPGG
jgi:predicted nucleic acid-binding protein